MKHSIILLFAAVLLFSCGGDKKETEKQNLPSSVGLPCELLVVWDPELQRGDLKDSIESITEGNTPGLAGEESIFRTSNVTPRSMIPELTVMHSQVFFLLDSKQERTRIGVAYDVKARPQIIVQVVAPTADDMRRWLGAKREEIQRLLFDFQVQRLAAQLRKEHSPRVDKDLQQLAGYSVCAPTAMVATKRGQDFLWGSTNRNMEDMNFLFYTYPWDGEPLTATDFAEHRDSVLKANIPGSKPTQWMTTSRGLNDMPAVTERTLLREGGQMMEVRGLWELHAGYMGGPFVAHVWEDTVTRRVICAEGFVYNPQGNKRDMMRQLEAMLYTLKQVND